MKNKFLENLTEAKVCAFFRGLHFTLGCLFFMAMVVGFLMAKAMAVGLAFVGLAVSAGLYFINNKLATSTDNSTTST